MTISEIIMGVSFFLFGLVTTIAGYAHDKEKEQERKNHNSTPCDAS